MTTVTAKVSDGEKEKIQEAAAKLGMTPSKFLKFAAEMQSRIDPIVGELVRIYSEGLGIPGEQVIEAFLIMNAANITAAEVLFGNAPDALLPFIVRTDGTMAKGTELYDYLVNRFIDNFAPSPEAAKKARKEIGNTRDEAAGEVMRDHYAGAN